MAENQPQEINPLQKKLSPEQFQASIKFYEADHVLDTPDREQLANDLEKVVGSAYAAGYGLGMAGFISPSLYASLVAQKQGIKRKFVIKQPFISVCLGFAILAAAHQTMTSYKFKQKIQQLENGGDPKQLAVWKSMDHHQSSLFYLYYKQSSKDPSFVIKDPRTFKEHDVQFHAKQGANKVQHFGNAMGMGAAQGSHWQEIRKDNGYEEANEVLNKAVAPEVPGSQHQEDESLNSKDSTKEYKSAWDRIRNK